MKEALEKGVDLVEYEKKVEEYRQMVQKMKMESVEKRDGGALDADMRLQLEARDQQIQSMKVVLWACAHQIDAAEEEGCGDRGAPLLRGGDDEEPVTNLYHARGLFFTLLSE